MASDIFDCGRASDCDLDHGGRHEHSGKKLLELGIYVPEAAQRYRAGKGCLIWLAAEGEEVAAIFQMPVTREQYEGMMAAGLLGDGGWHVAHAYAAPVTSDSSQCQLS